MHLYDDSTVVFVEVQRFRQPVLWALLIAVILVTVGIFVLALFTEPAPEDRPGGMLEKYGPYAGAALPMVIMAAVGLLFFLAALRTEVRSSGLYVRFFPFHSSFKKIPLEGVKDIKAVTYRPIMDYGGWGIRYAWKGKAYNVSGNRGVRLDFHHGKHLLIGSQRSEELARALLGVWSPIPPAT